jgi:FkbM family methyltransferase
MSLQITDGPNYYIQYKDEFIRQIYNFESGSSDPKVIDGGSNVGMSILYFKRLYPRARVIGFEPDPDIFRILEANLRRNGVTDVRVINAALAREDGTSEFAADESAGGQVTSRRGSTTVNTTRLSSFLDEDVDFLKLNIEGQELEVLREASEAGKLRNVRKLVVEYHGWANKEQLLGAILNLLDAQGFRYVLHDFDQETNPSTKPPFRWKPTTDWFCLIYAVRDFVPGVG